MISSHTPPGTPLVVVWLPGSVEELLSTIRESARPEVAKIFRTESMDINLWIGQRVTLAEIKISPYVEDGFVARIIEREGAYMLKCFDIAVLPSSLVVLLAPDKVPEPA